eukprot:m.48491 g.48491  ORF g.48491 m.48491 type:complete len:56 (-) comp7399_c1_seq1:69-236(-)
MEPWITIQKIDQKSQQTINSTKRTNVLIEKFTILVYSISTLCYDNFVILNTNTSL